MRRRTRTYAATNKADLRLGDVARKKLKLIGWCQKCGRQVEADPAEQVASYGDDLSVADWRAHFGCSDCAPR
jgi:hypothetical protein